MKKQRLLLMLLCLTMGVTAATAAACGDDDDSSSTPPISSSIEEVSLSAPVLTLGEDNVVTWAAVEGATGYIVNYNGTDYPASASTGFAAQTDVGTHTIKVKATDGENSSEYSNSVSYSIYGITLTAGDGYTLTGASSVNAGKTYTFTLTKGGIEYDYSNMVVKCGDTVLTETDGVYTIENVSANLTITVEGVALKTYDVTLPTVTGVTITGEAKAKHGLNYTFTVNLDEGYTDSNLVVKNGDVVLTAVDGVYTIENVTSDLTITVEGVALNVYSVQKTGNAAVTITGADTVTHGENYTFTLNVNSAYDTSKMVVKVNGNVVEAVDGAYTVQNVGENLVITIEGIDIKTYDVTLPALTGATVTGDATVEHGATYSVTIALDDAYNRSDVKVFANGSAMTLQDGKWIIQNVGADLIITVEGVVLNTYAVSVAESDKYTVTGVQSVTHGEACELTITSKEYFLVVSVGETEIVPVDDVYTIENVTADITVSVKTLTLEEAFLSGAFWEGAKDVVEGDGTLTFTIVEDVPVDNEGNNEEEGVQHKLNGWIARLKESWVAKALALGYTEMTFNVATSGNGPIAAVYNNSEYTSDASTWFNTTEKGGEISVLLTKLENATFVLGDQNTAWATLTLSNVKLEKYKIVNWTTNKAGMIVKQDGDTDTYIIDNRAGEAWTKVTVAQDVWAKYAGKENARMRLTWISWEANAEGTEITGVWTNVGVDIFMDISNADANASKTFEIGYRGHVAKLQFYFAETATDATWTYNNNIITAEGNDTYYVEAKANWAGLTPSAELWSKYAGKAGAKIKITWIKTPTKIEHGIRIGNWYPAGDENAVVDISGMDANTPIAMEVGYTGNACLLEFVIEE